MSSNQRGATVISPYLERPLRSIDAVLQQMASDMAATERRPSTKMGQ